MNTVDTTKPVLITGATGYVAGWIVKKLLDEGHRVHATVRDPGDENKLQYLNALARNSPGSIQYFKADLLVQGSFDAAMEGCEVVFHTASPFINTVKDPYRDLLAPALEGTREVLNSVNRTPSVKRVVLTSSVAAIIGDAADLKKIPGGTADETIWNTSSTLTHQAYSYSKTMAEKAAWEIHDAQARWELVVINPSLVLGPGISPRITSESYNIIKQLGDGTMKLGVPDFRIGMVDVRDLAQAHYAAGFSPASGRYIISAECVSLLQLADMLRDAFGNQFPLPKRTLPKFLVWLGAPMSGIKRKMVSRNIGYPYQVDNSKGKRELGMTYRPVKESIVDFFGQIFEVAHGETNEAR